MTHHTTHGRAPGGRPRLLYLLVLALFAALSLSADGCEVDEPNRCEQMGGYCAPMGEMCEDGFSPGDQLDCSMTEMEWCCLPDDSCGTDGRCGEAPEQQWNHDAT